MCFKFTFLYNRNFQSYFPGSLSSYLVWYHWDWNEWQLIKFGGVGNLCLEGWNNLNCLVWIIFVEYKDYIFKLSFLMHCVGYSWFSSSFFFFSESSLALEITNAKGRRDIAVVYFQGKQTSNNNKREKIKKQNHKNHPP